MARIEGILPALITPMQSDGAVHYPTLERMVAWLYDQGVDGLYVCGTSGEGMLLSTEEREQLVSQVVALSRGRGKVIVHVGAVATSESLRLARHAEKVGADAFSSVPPFAYGRSPEGMMAHYRTLAEGCSLPLYLYNIPSITSIHVTAALAKPLLELKSVRGLKFSDADLFAEFQLCELSEEFDVFHGCDETLLYGMMVGAVGGIGLTYSFAPTLYVEMFKKFHAGDLHGAQQLQQRSSRIIDLFMKHCGPNMILLAKMLMGRLGFDCGPTRAPNPPLPASRLEEFLSDLKRRGLSLE